MAGDAEKMEMLAIKFFFAVSCGLALYRTVTMPRFLSAAISRILSTGC
jgi:hypothetical protein